MGDIPCPPGARFFNQNPTQSRDINHLAENQVAIYKVLKETRAAVDRIDGAENAKRAQAAADTAETAADNATQNALRAGAAAEVITAAAPLMNELQKLNRKIDAQEREIKQLNQKVDNICCLIS